MKQSFEKYALLIKSWYEEDLAFRQMLIDNGKLQNNYNSEMESIHLKNARRLEKLIDELSYPTADLFGREAEEAAWMIIQHAVSRPDFMKKCLKHLQGLVNSGKGNSLHLAYLTDRILCFEGKKQLYGTQFDWDSNLVMSPMPYDALSAVNKRRSDLGLNTIEEQTELMRRRVKEEGQQAPEDYLKYIENKMNWSLQNGWITQ